MVKVISGRRPLLKSSWNLSIGQYETLRNNLQELDLSLLNLFPSLLGTLQYRSVWSLCRLLYKLNKCWCDGLVQRILTKHHLLSALVWI